MLLDPGGAERTEIGLREAQPREEERAPGESDEADAHDPRDLHNGSPQRKVHSTGSIAICAQNRHRREIPLQILVCGLQMSWPGGYDSAGWQRLN